ncbi:anti-sigma factor [Sphingobium sp.]|uniref:anti-sigma factor n=1 Tax=Sphingobium sp. TaxID=1912891 RepID=UPI003B3A8C40
MVDDPTPPDRQGLAAELALGLLEGQDRAEALRMCLSDPAFAAEVDAWGHRLSPLLDMTRAEAPSERVWVTIEARTADLGSLRRKLRLWRGGAIFAGAIAACLALVLILPVSKSVIDPVGVSQLADAQRATLMAVSYDPRTGLLRLSASGLGEEGKSPELWVIPEDGVPRSLGLIGAQGGALPVDPDLRAFLRDGVTLAITMEDPETAPHRAPSAAPVLTGKISII